MRFVLVIVVGFEGFSRRDEKKERRYDFENPEDE